MNRALVNLVEHMRWADDLVADALEREPRAGDDVVRVFSHIAACEALWYARIQGRTSPVAVWPTLALAQARALAHEHAALFEQLVRSSSDDALAKRVHYRNSAGRDFESSVGEIVTHVAMHGSHHRGQILQLLRASGREPPYVDFIQFMRRDQNG
ncbi:MAG: DinB family protein [Gemmatimonadaceae bacterium]